MTDRKPAGNTIGTSVMSAVAHNERLFNDEKSCTEAQLEGSHF